MLAVELTAQGGDAHAVCERLMGLGYLCKDTHDHTVRISPPLVLTRDQADGIGRGVRAGAG